MAKHGKTLPARRQRTSLDDSLLIRSAESLGRMIGSLQRQLDGAARKLPAASSLARMTSVDGHGNSNDAGRPRSAKRAAKAANASKGASKSGATKVRSTGDRTSKRAAKSAAAKKSAGRSRSGASRKTAKTTRRT